MEPPIEMRMNLFAFSRNKVLALTGLLLLFWIAAMIASLFVVPEIYEEVRSTSSKTAPMPGRGANFIWEVNDLSKFHQQMYLSALLIKQYVSPGFVIPDINVTVQVSGRAHYGDDWTVVTDGTTRTRAFDCTAMTYECQNVTLAHIPFVDFSSYRMNVSFQGFEDTYGQIEQMQFIWRMRYDKFTLLEVFFRFITLLYSIGVTFAYFWRIRNFPYEDWAYEQKWTGLLLFLLIGFNNPVFPITIVSDSWVPLFIDTLLQTTFLAFLLFYWLCLFHGMRIAIRPITFYMPKMLLMGLLWLSALVISTWEQLHILDDPSYSTLQDIDGFVFFAASLATCAGIYVLYFSYHIVRTAGEMRHIPDLDARLRAIVGVTIIVLIISISGMVMTAFEIFSLATAFFTYYLMFNIYVSYQALLYAPSSEHVTEQKLRVTQSRTLLSEDGVKADGRQGSIPLESMDEFPDSSSRPM